MSPPNTDSPGSLPGRGIQLLDSLHRHARLVVLLFFAVTALGLPMVVSKGQPSYQTSATLQVSPRYMKTLRDDIELEFQSNTQFLQFIQQQARTVNRFDVVQLALQRLDDAESNTWTREGESTRKAIERLQRSLAIRHVRDTYLIQVSLVTGNPDGIENILNAVVEAYLDRARAEQVFGADQRVENLKLRERDLLDQIESMTRERTAIGRELGVTSFNPDDINPFDRRARQLEEDFQDARMRRVESEARLNAFLEQGETDTTMRSIQETLLSDPGLNSLKASLNQRRAELLAATSGLATTHPAYLDAQDELADIEREIAGREAALRQQLSHGVESRHRSTTTQALAIEAQLQAMVEEVAQQADAYAESFNRAVSLTNHLRLLWNELDRVRDRLNFFEAEEASPGFSRLVTPALAPLYPTGTGKKKLLLMVLVAATALSLAAPVVVDLLDRRIRTVNDVHRTLGFAAMGWIVEAADPDRSRFAEDQMRRLASGLVRDSERHGTRIIVITGVRPGAGTTWVTRSLTRTLNQMGFSTLAVEANAYRPDPVYGTGIGAGLASALEHGAELPPINMDDPEVPALPVGTHPRQRSLANLQRLQSVLQSAPEPYRFVLVDAPPLLASSDAELIAAAGDAVLLMVEAGGISRGELGRAGRLLQSIDPPVVGAVVNRISAFHGGGYVDALIQEHRAGRKVQPNSPLDALVATATELVRTPFLMLRDAMSLAARLKPRRSRRGNAARTEDDLQLEVLRVRRRSTPARNTR